MSRPNLIQSGGDVPWSSPTQGGPKRYTEADMGAMLKPSPESLSVPKRPSKTADGSPGYTRVTPPKQSPSAATAGDEANVSLKDEWAAELERRSQKRRESEAGDKPSRSVEKPPPGLEPQQAAAQEVEAPVDEAKKNAPRRHRVCGLPFFRIFGSPLPGTTDL